MSHPVYIYALVNRRTRHVDYVGKTIHPHKRHVVKCKPYGMAILRCVSLRSALRIESQVIRAFKRRGECDKNTYTRKRDLGKAASHLTDDLSEQMRVSVDNAEFKILTELLNFAPKRAASGAPNLTWAAKQLRVSRPTVVAKARKHGLWPWTEGKK